jgi:type II secretory ATPase GspE/PulE/Tfp pilus assembly ATPase PilB-like protein
MRLLRESSRPESLEELGLTGRNMDIVKKSILRPHGMILVTGPTGSGKTTTLYSVLNILNTTKVKICTIEDPIEYGINRVSQIQVSSKGELNFAAGLRALLRHDPDIMMVGEIRDGETAQIAVHASLTGHLVLSTLHTNDAIGALPRLLDMGVEAYLVASTVNVVLAQRLVRKICTACLVEYHPDPNLISSVTKTHADKLKNQKYYKGAGCTECGSSGFTGRIGIYEVLEVTPEIGELINKRAASDQILDVAKSQGMTNMLEDGLDKVSSGLTTIEEVMKAVLEN